MESYLCKYEAAIDMAKGAYGQTVIIQLLVSWGSCCCFCSRMVCIMGNVFPFQVKANIVEGIFKQLTLSLRV